MTKAAYVIGYIDVSSPERYEIYKALGTEATRKFGGTYIVRGGPHEVLEGDITPRRVAIIRFPSYEKARDWYHSAEYRRAIDARMGAAISNLVLVEGSE